VEPNEILHTAGQAAMVGTDRLAAAKARVAEVDAAFGDPWHRDNPIGFTAIGAADEAGELPAEGVRRYNELGLNQEFVPVELGGRLDGLDLLGPTLRPIFRRDAALATGCALTAYMAATVVWLNGDEAQRKRLAEVLLNNGTATIAFQRFDHANEFVSDEFLARRAEEGDGFVFSGRKLAINNAAEADLLITFASVGDNAYSVFQFDPDEAGDKVRRLPRHATNGARGLKISGLEFADAPLPAATLVGKWGDGTAVGLRTFPVIHSTVPSMVVGIGDTALRTAARFAQEKGAYTKGVLEVPKARAALAGTFADLLIGDCLSLVATRAVQLVPDQCDVLGAVVKYVVPKLVSETMYHLSVVMGDAFHARSGHNAIFRKHVRDLATVTFGHVSSAVCQATIAPYLPVLATEKLDLAHAAHADLFRMDRPLPALDPDKLAIFGGSDGLGAHLATAAAELPAAVVGGAVGQTLLRQLELLRGELAELQEACAALDGSSYAADPKAFPLTDRYALVLAAAACLGVWLNAGAGPDEFLNDPCWLVLSLHRLLRRLGLPGPQLPAEVEQRVCEETLRRATEARSYDLFGVELSG
jgi:alkylation response protein AidB-like acyl-CoA dehydrogenase